MRWARLRCAIGFASILLAATASSAAQTRGVVYHDRDGDGKQGALEFGIRGVAVSNGRDVVTTDWRGRYRIRVDAGDFVFVVKPGGWQSPLSADRLPRYYYQHKPGGSPPDLTYPGVEPTGPLPERIDFPLHRSREPRRFDAILLADPQPYSLEQLDWLEHDVIEELIGTDARFGLTLGDLVGDDLSLFGPLNRAIARIGIPWHNVLGNHDLNYRAHNDADSDDTFERVYGPTHYAFVYGRVHFIVLDNVFYAGVDLEAKVAGPYSGRLDPAQLEFVSNYLETVPRDRLVVLAMHIPFDSPPHSTEQRRALFGMLKDRPHTLSLVGHKHFQQNQFFGPEQGFDGAQPHHQLIAATASGSGWLGAPDELGIPHATMNCGAPNGYSILEFDGNRYAIRFKAARRPADYQMNVFAPEAVDAERAADSEIVANVFAGSERSRVEFRLGEHGPWLPMSREARPDPGYTGAVERDRARTPRPPFFLPPIIPSPHIWVAPLPTDPPRGTHTLTVRSVDMYGREHTGRRVIRID